MKKVVFAIAKNPMLAQQIVDQLRNSDFVVENISILVPESAIGPGSQEQVKGKSSPSQKSKAPWSATGEVFEEEAVYGQKGTPAHGIPSLPGSLSKLKGISNINVQGFGKFIVAGQIKSYFAQAAQGFVQTLSSLGLPKVDAQKLEQRIKSGHVLIAVHLQNGASEELNKAKDALRNAHAEEISFTQEIAEPRKNK